MLNNNERVNDPAKKEVLITRIFEAPIDLVFSMWTNPEYLARWWGPKNNTNPSCEMDVRPGGSIKIMMQTGDGQVIQVTGLFNEINAPYRLVLQPPKIKMEMPDWRCYISLPLLKKKEKPGS